MGRSEPELRVGTESDDWQALGRLGQAIASMHIFIDDFHNQFGKFCRFAGTLRFACAERWAVLSNKCEASAWL